MSRHPKDILEEQKGEMKLERESFINHWRELAEFVRPRRGRFLDTDRNRGDKSKHKSIVNSKATKAYQVAKSGMLAGTMSPTRPWFSLESTDLDLMERQDVKEWLHTVERIMGRIFQESNFYGMATDFLGELLLFGTAAMTHEDDFEDVARFLHSYGR